MPRHKKPRFQRTTLGFAAAAALAPWSALALDLSESPPGTVEPYVRPNVIISVDDSGSMDWQITNTNTGLASIKTPNPDGSWDPRAKRMEILRYSLTQVFNDTNLLPKDKIRLSWQTMWNGGGSPNAENVDSASMNENSMRELDKIVGVKTQRENFLQFVKKLKPVSNTYSHRMFSQADAYMRRPLSSSSPWSSNPGGSDGASTQYLGCRRSYHIFMSDGRWNGGPFDSGAQDDATNKILPDSTVYGGTTAADRKKSALYRDTYSDTLADWAFKSWADPLQTSGLTGTMQPAADYRKAPTTETFGNDSDGNPATLERYWNPRYDPATWAHMVTYTIGFSTDATTWPGASSIIAPTQQVPFGYDNSFLNFVTGKQTWPSMNNENKRALDLWHAALNGRGRFYAVMKGEDLEKAFREIVGQIKTANDPDVSSSATSGANISRSDVGKYTAAYDPNNAWKGFVVAEKLQTDGTTVVDPAWGGKNTADKLDALANVNGRLVLTWSDVWETSKFKGGVPFKWASDESRLSTAQKLWLQTSVGGTDEGATKGEERLNYIRGEKALEGSETNGYTLANPYRERKSRQGDIVNSDVWYTGAPTGNSLLKGYSAFVRNNKSRPGMLYVGGNDGMLHGFGAADGEEKIAYVPRGVIPGLNLLTDPQYNQKHKYFVDGSPMTGDVDMGVGTQDPDDPSYDPNYTPGWRTLLVGTLGLGGKGYYILDVTNPTSTTVAGGPPGFAEGNASQLVTLDRTRGTWEAAPNCSALTGTEKTACTKAVTEDMDIGHITARPVRDENDSTSSTQITRTNNNRWAVILGNGYNSANERPVLLIQYLDGSKELLRIPVTSDAAGTGNANDNGLSTPRVVDLNGDGRTDIVYAGDNLGNLWKFDLTNIDSAEWKVAFGGSPLFTARGPASLSSSGRTKTQPIAAPPSVRANNRSMLVGSGPTAKSLPVGGMMVAFGTGRNITKTDPENVNVQTLYSVLDNTRYRQITTALGKRLEVHPGAGTCPLGPTCVPTPTALGTGVTSAKLAKQKFTELSGGEYGTVDVVDDLKKDTWKDFNGWYLDFPSIGERLLKPLEFYDSSNLLTVWSQVPAKGSKVDPNIESCESSSVDEERQYRTFLNIVDGKRPPIQLVDMNGDKIYNSAGDKDVSRAKVTKGAHSMIRKNKHQNKDVGNGPNGSCSEDGHCDIATLPDLSLRPSWRQLR